ncbi:hypothetical protein VTJ04DRAFT_343 [Mycothermus thermophilus]|uniref:uncharacterized protein n=1 Tax=Humicola insolens TaxID=85995 RepID=UPI0037440A3F
MVKHFRFSPNSSLRSAFFCPLPPKENPFNANNQRQPRPTPDSPRLSPRPASYLSSHCPRRAARASRSRRTSAASTVDRLQFLHPNFHRRRDWTGRALVRCQSASKRAHIQAVEAIPVGVRRNRLSSESRIFFFRDRRNFASTTRLTPDRIRRLEIPDIPQFTYLWEVIHSDPIHLQNLRTTKTTALAIAATL